MDDTIEANEAKQAVLFDMVNKTDKTIGAVEVSEAIVIDDANEAVIADETNVADEANVANEVDYSTIRQS